MNIALLDKHLKNYKIRLKTEKEKYLADINERTERINYYQSWTKEKLSSIGEDNLYEYLSKLWAMLIWGNKKYVIDKIINDNSLQKVQSELSEFIWGNNSIEKRWDNFRKKIKGFGPAMMSELLCQSHPTEYMIWNRRAQVALDYLGVKDLPKYNYQCTGKKYKELCNITKEICIKLSQEGLEDSNLLTVDYFFWDELQVEPNLSNIYKKEVSNTPFLDNTQAKAEDFIHNEIRDKIADIGQWLGFNTKTEVKVAKGAVVDTIWESTIGNMGRVIYVFEVQTKGSIDSLLLNLLKSLNNQAVQGVVAVSDLKQIEKIKEQSNEIQGLAGKLKTWDYKEVLANHEALELVNESINKLKLVPEGFYK